MYKVYWINMGYYAEDTFENAQVAIDYGKSKCFEFSVYGPDETIVATWSPINGLKKH